jgi:Fe-S-cluster containining protein
LKAEDIKLMEQAKIDFQVNKKSFLKIASKKKQNLDEIIHNLHHKEFKKRDCLDCANCCKTTSPIFRDIDIKRIAKHLREKESNFINQHLRLDEENDWVLKSSPCPFLGIDNKCEIYDVRPLACREYPHTDRKNNYQIANLTIANTLVCPAVVNIVNEIKIKFN